MPFQAHSTPLCIFRDEAATPPWGGGTQPLVWPITDFLINPFHLRGVFGGFKSTPVPCCKHHISFILVSFSFWSLLANFSSHKPSRALFKASQTTPQLRKCWALEQQNPEITTSSQASQDLQNAEFLYPYGLLTAAAEPGHSHLLSYRKNSFSWCFSPHFITSSVTLRGPGVPREHFHPSELHSPTMDSWNQTQHFLSLYILQGPQLHQRICLLSLNLSLSIQKPKKPPTKLQGSFSQLCLLKTLIKRNINQNPVCREGHFSLTLRASSKRVFSYCYRQKASGVSKKNGLNNQNLS